MESLGYKQKNKMVYQMIENMKQKSIDFDQFLDMMTARIVSRHTAAAAHTTHGETTTEHSINEQQCSTILAAQANSSAERISSASLLRHAFSLSSRCQIALFSLLCPSLCPV